MFRIEGITSAPKQEKTIILPDDTEFTMVMRYIDSQSGWWIDNLTYVDFKLNGLKIVRSINLLDPFRNIIPFGLACTSNEDREPYFIQDFERGFCSLFLLINSDKRVIENFLKEGTLP